MIFNQTLSAELPPPRDDEPNGLRQDILDELADHLACAYRREVLRGVDGGDAQARVLERFGNPAAVARRLWLDAMKGKIMLQRTVVATCLVMMLLCVGFTGFAWVQMNRARVAAELNRAQAAFEAAQANRRAAEALAASNATNKELLGQIRQMSETLWHPRSPDWIPLRVKLTQRSFDGPPVQHAIASVQRAGESPAQTISRVASASGIVDFGLVQPGIYQFNVELRWDGGSTGTVSELDVRPGSELEKNVICPETPLDQVVVTARCDLPHDLEAQDVVLYANFTHRDLEVVPGVKWWARVVVAPHKPAHPSAGSRTDRLFNSLGVWSDSPARALLCGPGRERMWTKDARGLYLWALTRSNSDLEMQEIAKTGRGVRADILERDLDSRPGTKRMEVGSYTLERLLVLRPRRSQDVPAGHRRYDVLAACLPGAATQVIEYLQGPLAEGFNSIVQFYRGYASRVATNLRGLPLPPDYWTKAIFEARSDRPNNWTIPIPDELIKAVRDRLAADSADHPKAAPEKPNSKP